MLAHASGDGTVENLRQRHASAADPERLLSRLNALGTLGLTLTLASQSATAAEMSEAPRASGWCVAELSTPADHQSLPVSDVARCARLEDTWAKVYGLRSALGITRVADLTDYDRVGIPVVGATRPSVDGLQITATQGKGMDLLQARVSALMEAVERHAAAQARPTLRASVNELRARKERWVAAHTLGVEFPDAAPIEWLSTRSLRTGQTAWIPAAEVLFPYRAPAGVHRPVRPSTTGLSSGNTAAEAVLHALCEVAERAAVSRYLDGNAAPLVDLSRLPDGVERDLARRFEEAGVELAVYDLSGLGPLATYFVSTVSPDNLGAPVVTAGQGSSLDARLALRRALLEAAQSRVVALQGSREDLVRHASAWTSDGAAACQLWEQTRATAMSHGVVAPPVASPSSTVAEALAQVLKAFEQHGHTEAFITDITQPKIGLCVVHACVPGLNDWVVEATRGRHAR